MTRKADVTRRCACALTRRPLPQNPHCACVVRTDEVDANKHVEVRGDEDGDEEENDEGAESGAAQEVGPVRRPVAPADFLLHFRPFRLVPVSFPLHRGPV